MIRIVIADDHLLLRDGLRKLLEIEPFMEVVGEASDTGETFEVVREIAPDVLLLGIRMPGQDSVETVRELKRLYPEVKVVMMTAQPEDHYAIRCLKHGADGYLTKEHAGDHLMLAIRKVYAGGKYISGSLAATLAMSLQSDFGKAPHESLSDREFQVMRMIASGLTVSEIGEDLRLSVKTVSTYRTRILEKMQFRNNAEITKYCLNANLI